MGPAGARRGAARASKVRSPTRGAGGRGGGRQTPTLPFQALGASSLRQSWWSSCRTEPVTPSSLPPGPWAPRPRTPPTSPPPGSPGPCPLPSSYACMRICERCNDSFVAADCTQAALHLVHPGPWLLGRQNGPSVETGSPAGVGGQRLDPLGLTSWALCCRVLMFRDLPQDHSFRGRGVSCIHSLGTQGIEPRCPSTQETQKPKELRHL